MIREGTPDDWGAISLLLRAAREREAHITAGVWTVWTSPGDSFAMVAEDNGQLRGFAAAFEMGAASWWMAGPYLHPDAREGDTGERLIDEVVELFGERGSGLLRTASFEESEGYESTMQGHGFRHILSYMRMEGATGGEDIGAFEVLRQGDYDALQTYLRFSPMYRVNSFLEQDNVLDYLGEERVKFYLSSKAVTSIGWRQFDMVHGTAMVRFKPRPPYQDALYINYLDAPDDTTLRSMLAALRAAAGRQGLQRFVWKMPLSIGLEQQMMGYDWQPTWDAPLKLYELPIRLIG